MTLLIPPSEMDEEVDEVPSASSVPPPWPPMGLEEFDPKDHQTVRMVITPEVAKDWLRYNVSNRNLSQTQIDRYADDMIHGRWKPNTSDSIGWTVDGVCNDGQHRLSAIVKSGREIHSWVTLGCSSDSAITDAKARRLGDHLQMLGYPQATILGSLINGLIRWEDEMGDANEPRLNGGALAAAYGVSASRAINWLETHSYQELTDALRVGGAAARAIGAPGSPFCVMAYVLTKMDAEDASDFFEKIKDGVGLPENSPIFQLRKRFLQRKLKKASMSYREQYALIIKAWNFYREGAACGELRFRAGGASPERFPVPR